MAWVMESVAASRSESTSPDTITDCAALQLARVNTSGPVSIRNLAGSLDLGVTVTSSLGVAPSRTV